MNDENSHLVSVLMPVFNEARYLASCIRSILSQDYPHWELIIVDDHSTDETKKLANYYGSIDPRIRLYENEGKGVISALRLALHYATGKYITRMDGDDIMACQRLSTMVGQLEHFGKGHVSVGLVKYFHDCKLGEGYKKYEAWLNRLSAIGDNFKGIYKECSIPSPCWCLFKEDLIRIGGFDPDVYPEDYDLCFRMYKHELSVIPAKEVLLYWRDYEARSSRNSELYADNRFLDLKLFHFLNIDHNLNNDLLLWGAGKKGKFIAQYFISKGISFRWVCNNPKKQGKNIFGKVLQSSEEITFYKPMQIIIAVANPNDQSEIRTYLENSKLIEGNDFYFFC